MSELNTNWHDYDEPTAVWSAQGGQPEEKNLLKNEKRNPQNHQNKNRTKEYEGNCLAVPNHLTTYLWTLDQETPFYPSLHLHSWVSEQNFQEDTMSIQQASRHRSSPQVLRRKGWNRAWEKDGKGWSNDQSTRVICDVTEFSGSMSSAIDMIDSFKSLQISKTRQICGIFRSRGPNQRKDARHRVLWQ